MTPTISEESRFSIKEPPKDSKKGMVESMTGEVKWTSRVATEEAALDKPIQIQQGENLETGEEGEVVVKFTDIGIVKMFSKSEVSFIQTLPANFVFSQTKGSVIYSGEGQMPISIRTFHLLTVITQGVVELSISENEPIINIVVKKGKIKVAFNNLKYESQVLELREGEAYIFNDEKLQGDYL